MQKNGSTRLKQKVFYIVKVDNRCTNRKIGQLASRFIKRKVNLRENNKFRNHLLKCLYCAAVVWNFKYSLQASEYYKVPIGPKLRPHLTKISLGPIPEETLREMLRKLAESVS